LNVTPKTCMDLRSPSVTDCSLTRTCHVAPARADSTTCENPCASVCDSTCTPSRLVSVGHFLIWRGTGPAAPSDPVKMLTALTIITAVPVVMYLLWMVYSHRYATLRKHVPWRRYGARGTRSKRGTVAIARDHVHQVHAASWPLTATTARLQFAHGLPPTPTPLPSGQSFCQGDDDDRYLHMGHTVRHEAQAPLLVL